MPPLLPLLPTEDERLEILRKAKAAFWDELALHSEAKVQAISQIEVPFQTYAGSTYQLEYSEDLINWTRLPMVYQGDGTVKVETFPNSEPKRFYRLFGSLPKGFQIITAWDGSYVLLERAPPEPGHKHRLYRNNQLIADIQSDTLNFKDTTIASGSRYTYTAEAYGS